MRAHACGMRLEAFGHLRFAGRGTELVRGEHTGGKIYETSTLLARLC